MGSGKSPWWRAFDKVERKIGKPLEDAADTSTYVDLMLTTMKLQRAVGEAVGRVAGGAVTRVLRGVNVPTGGDVRDLSRQISVLTGEVRSLKRAQQGADGTAKPSSTRRPKAHSSKESDDAA